MLGISTNPAAITTNVITQERSTLRCVNGWKAGASSRRSERWARSGGSRNTATTAMSRPMPATTKNGAVQPHRRASSRPAGTPSTWAIENEPITIPIARPRRSGGTTPHRHHHHEVEDVDELHGGDQQHDRQLAPAGRRHQAHRMLPDGR